MITLKYVSDIHLEFSDFPNEPFELNPQPDEILLVAGDTILAVALQEKRTDGLGRQMQRRFQKFLDEATKFKHVYIIAGNHEAYMGGDVASNKDMVNDFIDRRGYLNIQMVERQRFPLTEDTDLLAATLWTDMNKRDPLALQYVQNGLNDFRVCYYKGVPFTTTDAADIFDETLAWLKKELLDTSKNYVVMTHHLPSFQGIDPLFKGDTLNFGYASELDDFILQNQHITHWITGHTHYNIDYLIGNTRMISNCRGYPPGGYDRRRDNWTGFKTKCIQI